MNETLTVGSGPAPSWFRAGFAAADITPRESVPMDGYASSIERMSTDCRSPLYARALAVTDSQGSTAVLISVDCCIMPHGFYGEILDWVASTHGIPRENVILSAIHQHSCVDTHASYPPSVRYRAQQGEGIRRAVTEALEDRAPAEMYINSVQTQAMNFVRHYWTNDGTIFGDNYGSMESGLARHESDADPEMRLVKFTRGGKKDILLVNFQTHPHMGGGGQASTSVHSDWPGLMREAVEAQLGVCCLYFSGAGGNLNSTSRIEKENISKDYKDHGARAARYVIGAEGSYQRVSCEGIRGLTVTGEYPINHSFDHLYGDALRIHKVRCESSARAKAMLKDYPQFHSIYHASSLVNRRSMPQAREITAGLVAVGEVLFAALPYEMFDTNGMELRQGTVGNPNYTAEEQLENPFKMTVVNSLANGYDGYMPSWLNFQNGGYSVDICKYMPGTGERIVGKLLAAAQVLHK